jgi:hypothetical protein
MSPEQKDAIQSELKDILIGADEARSGVQGYDTRFADDVRVASTKIDNCVTIIQNILAKL